MGWLLTVFSAFPKYEGHHIMTDLDTSLHTKVGFMRIYPSNLPIFVYGTLKKGGLYHSDVVGQIEDSKDGIVRGELYYKIFRKNGIPEVTAAFDPQGGKNIAGPLLFPRENQYYSLLAKLDELEFNFDMDGQRAQRKDRLRVYLRDITLCTTEHGVSYLAWCYVYHPIISIPRSNMIKKENGTVTFNPELARHLLENGEIKEDRMPG